MLAFRIRGVLNCVGVLRRNDSSLHPSSMLGSGIEKCKILLKKVGIVRSTRVICHDFDRMLITWVWGYLAAQHLP